MFIGFLDSPPTILRMASELFSRRGDTMNSSEFQYG